MGTWSQKLKEPSRFPLQIDYIHFDGLLPIPKTWSTFQNNNIYLKKIINAALPQQSAQSKQLVSRTAHLKGRYLILFNSLNKKIHLYRPNFPQS